MLAIRRRGFSTTRSPAAAGLVRSSPAITINGEVGSGTGGIYGGYVPTVFAATSARGSGSGSSESNATTLEDALANATAGEIIGAMEGNYLRSGLPAYRSNLPAWRPANSGIVDNPIKIVGKYNPTAMANPLTDSARTELRSGSGSYNGSDSHPVIGANGQNHIHWVNIVVNEANCVTKSDNGPAYAANAVGTVFERLVIRCNEAALWSPSDNHNAIRIGEGTATTQGTIVRGCILSNVFNLSNDSNAAAIMTYGGEDFLIENCEVFDANSLLYIKGGGAGGALNSGIVRYNYLRDGSYCRVQFTDATDRVDIYQNIFEGMTNGAVFLNQACSSVRVYNNTFILSSAVENGAFYVNGGASSSTGLHLRDNIFYATGSNRAFVNAGNLTQAWGNLSGNQYFNTTSYNNAWSYNGSGYSSYSAWVSGSGETGSLNTDPGFIDFANGDYRLSVPNGKGAYITGAETIGARS